jgi:hypothetical protein
MSLLFPGPPPLADRYTWMIHAVEITKNVRTTCATASNVSATTDGEVAVAKSSQVEACRMHIATLMQTLLVN